MPKTKHNECNSRLYHIWEGMKSRCKKKGNKFYFEKGITVCVDWQSYENFRSWALSNGYDNSLTLDRINPNGNYEPSNCRWATWEVQHYNKSNTVRVEVNGETHTIKEWSDIWGIPRSTLYNRYYRKGTIVL